MLRHEPLDAAGRDLRLPRGGLPASKRSRRVAQSFDICPIALQVRFVKPPLHVPANCILDQLVASRMPAPARVDLGERRRRVRTSGVLGGCRPGQWALAALLGGCTGAVVGVRGPA